VRRQNPTFLGKGGRHIFRHIYEKVKGELKGGRQNRNDGVDCSDRIATHKTPRKLVGDVHYRDGKGV